MGTDKALLPFAGQRLIDLQISKLRCLRPGSLWVSSRRGIDYGLRDVGLVLDREPGLGPLGGLVALLESCSEEHLLLLAVDLPLVPLCFLASLLPHRSSGCALIPKHGKHWEPLVGLYPRSCLPLARKLLGGADRSLQSLLASLSLEQCLLARELLPEELPLFANWNRPEDCRNESLDALKLPPASPGEPGRPA